MERNKGEAIRAMQLSELMIQENNFSGAWEMARLAHQLFPEDENVCKLLALSEVYYSIFESGQSCQTGDTETADIEQLVEDVSCPSGTLNEDDDDESDDGDDDSDDDYDYDDNEDDDDDFDDHNEYDDHDTDDDGDGDDDLVVAPKRLREKRLKSPTEKEKNSVGVVSKSAVTRPKRLRHSQFLSVINRMHDMYKDHDTINSMKSSSTPASSSAAHLYDFDAQKSEDKIRVGQIWALCSDGNGMPKTFAQVKQINVKPNRRVKRTAISGKFYLRMGLLEPFSEPKNAVVPVCCRKFKVKQAPPTLFSVTSLSHRIEPKLLGQNIFEIMPRRGEVWALYKDQNPMVTCSNMRKGEWLVVEVLEVVNQKTVTVVLEQLNGFKSVFKAPTVQSTKSIIDIPLDELGRFSHQISAFKHTKSSNSRLAGCWELDPVSVYGYKDGVPKWLCDSDIVSPLITPDYSHDRGNIKMNQTSMKSETHGRSAESLEVEAEADPEMGSANMQTGNMQGTPFAERETPKKVELQVGHFAFFSKDIA